MSRVIRAPRGTTLSCRGWVQEAALRMLMNNLDPDVAENPDELVVYGGRGKAARDWESFDRIVAALQSLTDEETLLVQSGKPVGICRTHSDAPRVLIANSNLVGHWSNWEHFWDLEKKGLMMYGQMTAGSWIYIGTQGIVQGTYQTFAAAGDKHYGGDLSGRWIVSGGLGGMGGAQPLAATMAGACFLGVDVDAARIEKRRATKYLDCVATSLDDALTKISTGCRERRAISVGLCANAADIYSELVRRNVRPDLVTDQTSAHDPLHGYIPNRMTVTEALALRASDPEKYQRESRRTMGEQVTAMLAWHHSGVPVFDYGNNIRLQAQQNGISDAFAFPGFVPAYIRPLFCEGMGPFRFVALSGNPADIFLIDQKLREAFPDDTILQRWLDLATERIAFQGLPARICWLGYGARAIAGRIINDLVASGEISAPVVIGRDHLDCGSVASPYRETENMKDGSDAVADWPILNALVNTANGASWVSVHNGGGVGIGYSLHAGQVIVADGTPEAARRLERVLTSDPALGVMRHVDAGYEAAMCVAKERGVRIRD